MLDRGATNGDGSVRGPVGHGRPSRGGDFVVICLFSVLLRSAWGWRVRVSALRTGAAKIASVSLFWNELVRNHLAEGCGRVPHYWARLVNSHISPDFLLRCTGDSYVCGFH